MVNKDFHKMRVYTVQYAYNLALALAKYRETMDLNHKSWLHQWQWRRSFDLADTPLPHSAYKKPLHYKDRYFLCYDQTYDNTVQRNDS